MFLPTEAVYRPCVCKEAMYVSAVLPQCTDAHTQKHIRTLLCICIVGMREWGQRWGPGATVFLMNNKYSAQQTDRCNSPTHTHTLGQR